MNFFKKILINFWQYIESFLCDLLDIIKTPKKLFIWFFLLPLVFFSTILIMFFSIFFYLFFLFSFFKKFFIFYIKNKNTSPLKIRKPLIIFNHYFLISIYSIFIDSSKRRSYLYFYVHLNSLFNLKDLRKKDTKNIVFILEFLIQLFFIYMFRLLIYYVFSLPFIVLKNCNFVTNIAYNIMDLPTMSLKSSFSIFLLNVSVQMNNDLILKTHKLKIIFKKKKIIFNDKNLEMLASLVDIHLWINGTRKLSSSGIIADVRYLNHCDKKFLPYHPSILFKNKYKNEYLVINQTTQKSITILESNLEYNDYKKKELFFKSKGFYKDVDSYITNPHIVDSKSLKISDSIKLHIYLNNPNNFIKNFNFVQSFLLNLESELLQFDPETNFLKTSEYKTLKNYILMNYYYFDKNAQVAMTQLIEFYEKNRDFLNNQKIDFMTLLYKAEIDETVRKYFLSIINQYNE